MQSTIKDFDCLNGYTYQHIHGIMLTNLNHLSFEQKLSHSEYHLMGVLIGYWNKQHGKSFPTIKMLAKHARMSNSTIIKCLNSLTSKSLVLIVKDGKNGRQQYYINLKKLLNSKSNKHATKYSNSPITPCSNSHEQTNRTKIIDKTIINKKQSLKQITKPVIKNDDANFKLSKKKSSNDSEKGEIIKTLTNWNYSTPELLLEKYGKIKISEMIQIVHQKNVDNPGAYLRTILKLENKTIHFDNKTSNLEQQQPLIKRMIQFKYWKHIPSGKVYKILPDVGNHLLIKYCSDSDSVIFAEDNFSDQLKNFEIIENVMLIQEKTLIKEVRPEKEDIIIQLIKQNKNEEAIQLSKLWKLKIPDAS